MVAPTETERTIRRRTDEGLQPRLWEVRWLLTEIVQLEDQLDHWRKRALFAEQFIPKEKAT